MVLIFTQSLVVGSEPNQNFRILYALQSGKNIKIFFQQFAYRNTEELCVINAPYRNSIRGLQDHFKNILMHL